VHSYPVIRTLKCETLVDTPVHMACCTCSHGWLFPALHASFEIFLQLSVCIVATFKRGNNVTPYCLAHNRGDLKKDRIHVCL
jgi:hypothetical protein